MAVICNLYNWTLTQWPKMSWQSDILPSSPKDDATDLPSVDFRLGQKQGENDIKLNGEVIER